MGRTELVPKLSPFVAPRTQEEIRRMVEYQLQRQQDKIPENLRDYVRIQAQAIISRLPDTVKSREKMKKSCTSADNLAMTLKPDIQDAQSIRELIGVEIRLLLYEEYLNQIVARMQAYAEKNPPMKRWGLGAIARWKSDAADPWGRSFYAFWRHNVEPTGDTLFRTRLLPLFPQAWRKQYKMRRFIITFQTEDQAIQQKIVKNFSTWLIRDQR